MAMQLSSSSSSLGARLSFQKLVATDPPIFSRQQLHRPHPILSSNQSITTRSLHPSITTPFISLLLSCSLASTIAAAPLPSDTYQNVPSSISGTEKTRRIQKPNSAKAEACTRKCVGTCIRGGAGAPGEGPLNVRRPLVVFKEGFHSRQYCLLECSEICNLIGNGDDGP